MHNPRGRQRLRLSPHGRSRSSLFGIVTGISPPYIRGGLRYTTPCKQPKNPSRYIMMLINSCPSLRSIPGISSVTLTFSSLPTNWLYEETKDLKTSAALGESMLCAKAFRNLFNLSRAAQTFLGNSMPGKWDPNIACTRFNLWLKPSLIFSIGPLSRQCNFKISKSNSSTKRCPFSMIEVVSIPACRCFSYLDHLAS